MFSAAALALAFTLILNSALAVPLPRPTSEILEKRQNNPLFGGWDKNQNVTGIIAELSEQPNPIDRDVLLPADGLNFDFLTAKSFGGGGADGGVILADNTIFPGVVGNGMAMLVGFLGPCGMVAPHNHPRATEYLLNVAGPPLSAGSFQENGAPYVQGNLAAGSVTVLPLGSIHYVSNEGCDPAFIVAGFNSETPGVGFLSSMYTAFDPQTVNAAFGGVGAQVFNASKIPAAVNLGHQTCLQKCGINRNTFDIGNTTNHDLMKMAFAGYLKTQNYDYSTDAWKNWK